MTNKVIDLLEKLFLWSKVVDHKLVYKKISEYLPCTTTVLADDSTVILDFGKYQDINVTICLKFEWKDNVLINILNNN